MSCFFLASPCRTRMQRLFQRPMTRLCAQPGSSEVIIALTLPIRMRFKRRADVVAWWLEQPRRARPERGHGVAVPRSGPLHPQPIRRLRKQPDYRSPYP